MIKVKKYIIISSLFIILTIPLFFGIFIEYFTIRVLNWFVILIFILGLFLLLFLDKIIEIFGYDNKNVEVMRAHDVINAFINKNYRFTMCFFLLIIVIVEELIFRYYIIGVLTYSSKLESLTVIFISSLIFSLFHIHIWFRYRNLQIFLINLSSPFLLGFFNGYILITLGLLPCIAIHYAIVLYLYYGIYKRYFKTHN